MGRGKRAGGNHQPSVLLISPRWRLMSIVPQCLCSACVTAMSSSSLATPPSRPESQLFHSGTWNIFGSAPEPRRHAGELSDCLGSSPPAFAFPVVCTEPRADDRTRPYLSPGQQQEAGHGVPDADPPHVNEGISPVSHCVPLLRELGQTGQGQGDGKRICLVTHQEFDSFAFALMCPWQVFAPTPTPQLYLSSREKTVTISRSIFLSNMSFLPRFQVLKFKRQEFASCSRVGPHPRGTVPRKPVWEKVHR